jgi:Tfp pilus assembly protein PilV
VIFSITFLGLFEAIIKINQLKRTKQQQQQQQQQPNENMNAKKRLANAWNN